MLASQSYTYVSWDYFGLYFDSKPSLCYYFSVVNICLISVNTKCWTDATNVCLFSSPVGYGIDGFF